MDLVKISNLFDVEYGVNLELINLQECDKNSKDSINFVSRTDKNNGISAFVRKINNISPNRGCTISVAAGGSVLSTFFQKDEYYSGRDIYILIPKESYSDIEMLYYAYCIRQNKYRYNYGRQANKTLKDLLIPRAIPEEWSEISIDNINKLNKIPILRQKLSLDITNWSTYKLTDLFDITLGKPVHKDSVKEDRYSPLAYVTRTTKNNGIEFYVSDNPKYKIEDKNCITIGAEGFKAFFQESRFITGNKINVLRSDFLSKYSAIFILPIINLEIVKKFNYGRGATRERIANLTIKLPSKCGKPNWEFMENYVKSLPYSANL